MRSISAVLPALPGFPNPQPRAPWPVWRGSVAGPVRFAPLSRKTAAKLWHKARRWDRDTRQPGRHGGIIGRTALAALYALLFDFLNHRTGRLDPSLDAIAAKASCCRRAVVDALARLRDLGLIAWQRRCEETRDAQGRFRLRQRTNAYGLLPPSQWIGYREEEPPPLDPVTLGAPAPIPDPIGAAVAELTHGQRKAPLAALEANPGDTLARTLAAFGRAIEQRESGRFTGVHLPPRNTASDSKHTSTHRFTAPIPAPRPSRDDLEAAKQHWLHVLLGNNPPS